ncbi:MAG: hypothetical protein JWL76_1964 [Thermoleophilia bacterium]|nr:hypothetical protein [Thermoleophilia bacterium]
MSVIDSYPHERIADFLSVPVYRLLSDTPAQDSPDDHDELGGARQGDVVVGGGGGEFPAFRICLPESIQWFTGGWHWEPSDLPPFWVSNWRGREWYYIAKVLLEGGHWDGRDRLEELICGQFVEFYRALAIEHYQDHAALYDHPVPDAERPELPKNTMFQTLERGIEVQQRLGELVYRATGEPVTQFWWDQPAQGISAAFPDLSR